MTEKGTETIMQEHLFHYFLDLVEQQIAPKQEIDSISSYLDIGAMLT